MSKNKRILMWSVLAIFAGVLIVIRTSRIGWFAGKDWALWVVAGLSVARVYRLCRRPFV